MEIDILGIDLAKRVFQLHGADKRGHALHRSKVARLALMEAVRQCVFVCVPTFIGYLVFN